MPSLGFPQDGPFDARPVRIRSDQRLRSPDIYGDGTVTRHVYALRGLIRPGNSGGPVVSTAGRVLGVVFAASVSDPDTGYALTADQVRRAAAVGLDAESEGLQRQLRLIDPLGQPRLSRLLLSLACSIARSGAFTCLILRTPTKPSRPASST